MRLMRRIAIISALLLTLSTFRTAAQDLPELQLPAIPDELRLPSLRGSYLLEHFWDNIDLSTDERARDEVFMEQNFVNFLSVIPVTEEATQKTAIHTLLSKAAEAPEVYANIISLAEKYLYEPESPMASDDVYRIFLEEVLTSDKVDNYRKIRFRAQLHAVNQNKPGNRAADFTFEKPDGTYSSLYEVETPGNILLIFYDPDCDHCKQVMNMLTSDSEIRQLIEKGKFTVVAIYSGDEKELWAEGLSSLPDNWILGYEDGALQDDGRYVIRTMPTIYLLDSDKTVDIKEIPADNLLNFLK